MNGNKGNYLFLWEPVSENEARILRVFAESGEIIIPEQLNGKKVTEAGAYCFSRARYPKTGILYTKWNNGLEETGKIEELTDCRDWLHEAAESYVKGVTFPDTVKRIGACAFYNCTKMEQLSVGMQLEEIGSDAFMNCLQFHHLYLRCDAGRASGLKQLLAQIKWNVEVVFGKNKPEADAVIFFPEYYEGYDEIGPAHIFELNLTGEGFRARQCFKDGVLQLSQYDEIFPQACIEETKDVLIPMAWDRILWDKDLTENAGNIYTDYLKEQAWELFLDLIKKRDLQQMELFLKKGFGTAKLVEEAIAVTSGQEWAEGTASLLGWKREFFAPKQEQKVSDRYSFDDF